LLKIIDIFRNKGKNLVKDEFSGHAFVQRTENRGQKTENRGQRTETEDRRQKLEVRGQKTDDP